MNTYLLVDFESAIEAVSDVYFFNGFLTGFLVCVCIFAFALYLTR